MEIKEGTFTGTGLDLLAERYDPRPATTHIAVGHTPEPRPSWWWRLIVWLGFDD